MKKKDNYKVAVIGPRGAVGTEMRKILADRRFPVLGEPIFFVTQSSWGDKVLEFGEKKIPVQDLRSGYEQFKGIDIVLVSSDISTVKKEHVSHVLDAVKAGALVIDNTSAFRMDPNVPLVIPEINPDDIKNHRGIIANPNCSAMILLMAIAPLHRKNRIKRMICATYQSASGAGARAMRELETQTRDFLAGKQLKKEALPHQIAFNLFSHNSPISDGGYNEEELKVIQETKKILHDDRIRIGITCIRVPVLRAHSEAIHIEFAEKMTPDEARTILKSAPGVKLVDDAKSNHFPMPIEASGKDDVFVGRIREDRSLENGLALFVSGDQLRKGAALNAVQIAEKLIQ